VTLVNRLKAAPPHFVPHVKAPAPKIIMRRSSDLGKDRDPGARRHSPQDQKLTNGGPSLHSYSPSCPFPPALLGELPHASFDPCSCQRKRLTLTRN